MSEYILLGHADILTAFSNQAIGSKVVDHFGFSCVVIEAIRDFDWNSCRQQGQACIRLPNYACKYVSAGIGRRTYNPDDYIVRLYRDKVNLFLKRKFAVDVRDVSVVVYTTDAYLSDPDVDELEIARIKQFSFTHILVAILASSGEPSTLTPNRFVHNLAGGNKEALLWTADEIREKAKKIKDYSTKWCIVAD